MKLGSDKHGASGPERLEAGRSGTTLGRILLADDDPHFLGATRRMLATAGYHCETAPDSAGAAKLLSANSFDLLISDLEMPGNNNLDFIREVPRLAGAMPIILMTGYPTADSAIRSIQLPITAYLVKPCKHEELLEQVQRAIRDYRALQAVHVSQSRIEEWNRALAQMTEAMRSRRLPGDTPWRSLFEMTLSNIAGALSDLRVFADLSASSNGSGGAEEPLDAAQPMVLVNALRETIAVLERTKHSFRSKELGELRKKLELLVKGNEKAAKADKS